MFLSYLILFTALCLSGIAAFYSIAGLTAIFAAAVVPIIIMGGILEVAKLVVAVWLHEYWPQVKKSMKVYLTSAVLVLMFITSMGIFGFLSKAHIEQTAQSTQNLAQIEQIQEQIASQLAIIERSEQRIESIQTDGTGADQNLQAQIDREQKRIETAYDRVQPAIDETNKQLEKNISLYEDQITNITSNLDTLTEFSAVDTNDKDSVKRLQTLVGTTPDGAYGPSTAQAVREYKQQLENSRDQAFSKIEELKSQAREEIARLRSRAEAEIDESNKLVNRLRSQLGTDTGTDIESEITEQTLRIKNANNELDILTKEKFSLETEYRALEAEVGPVKYIAEFIYGEEADKNLLEEAVRWVIIVIVFVFDPLAVIMLLAATESIGWHRNEKRARQTGVPSPDQDRETESDPDGITIEDTREELPGESHGDTDTPNGTGDQQTEITSQAHEDNYEKTPIVYPEPEPLDPEEFENEKVNETIEESQEEIVISTQDFPASKEEIAPDDDYPGRQHELELYKELVDETYLGNTEYTTDPYEEYSEEIDNPTESINDIKDVNPEKIAKKVWKTQNPDDTLKHQEALLEKGVIDELPWETLAARIDEEELGNVDFGTKFPEGPRKGDTYIRVDYLPTKLYKYNGQKWIEIDKNSSDSFTYNDEYIEHLIQKIGSGEYDPELLNDNERDQIEQNLKNQDM